jgi:hypothetical protein
MKTSKAYLAGIGATGVLVGSIVGMLVLGSWIVAFDGVPDLGRAPAPLERVVLKEGGRGAKNDRARLTARRQARPAAARRLRPSRDRAPRGGRGAPGGGHGAPGAGGPVTEIGSRPGETIRFLGSG